VVEREHRRSDVLATRDPRGSGRALTTSRVRCPPEVRAWGRAPGSAAASARRDGPPGRRPGR
jgi:hypothetical protein